MKIISDTASLFSPEEGQELGIKIVPACVLNNGESYRDYEDITGKKFLEMIKNGAAPTSSQPAIGDLIDAFEESEEETLALFIGDGLSGGYQNAVGARNSMESYKHIRILDTKTLAGAERYLVQKAVQLRNKGMEIDAVIRELIKSIESSVSFVIPADFEYLRRSGRLTAIAAKISSMIRIVPVLTQTEDMKRITPLAVKRSWKKAVEAIVERLNRLGVNEAYRIYVCHAGDLKAAESVMKQIKEYFANVELELLGLSPTMMTHGGPGCVLVQAIKK